MFKKSDLETLREIIDLVGDCEVYLYGESLRNMCLGQEQQFLELLFIDNGQKIDAQMSELLQNYQSKGFIPIIVSEPIDWNKKLYTIDTIRLSVNRLINDNNGDIEADKDRIKHLIDRELAFTEYGMEKLLERPELMFDSIILASQHGMSFEFESMKFVFSNRHKIKDVDRKLVNKFLTELFYKSHKIRKGIAMINTLGISVELFGQNLNESSILNHLNKKDLFEYYAIIFINSDPVTLDDFLIEKVGFNSWDIKHVVNETRALLSVESEDDITARRILSSCGTNRLQSLVRLFKLYGYKDLSRKIKEQKDAIFTHKELAITLQDVQASFRVTENEAHKILDMALEKVILEPHLNDQYKLLASLNKDLESAKHG